MFYCETCRKKQNLYESIGKSYGTCELCGEVDICNDAIYNGTLKGRRPRND